MGVAIVIFVVLAGFIGMPWPIALLIAWLYYECDGRAKEEDR